ncbi:MAG: PhzF family phenazine biosynthesis protein [Sphingomonadales bacterium]|nr:PhzF family phenazine biosynthesis protein [Sphingomonadales bacterium]
MRLSFHTLDVFTTTRFGGNPLAVVLDADALDTAMMQTVAREFNLSETVFVMKPDNPAHSARVRIFTPAAEIPFAGHPTVGTAALLAELRNPAVSGEQDAIIVLEEKIGAVRVGVKLRSGSAALAEFDAPATARRGTESHPARTTLPQRWAYSVRDRLREPSSDPIYGRQRLHLRTSGHARGHCQGSRLVRPLGHHLHWREHGRRLPLYAAGGPQHVRLSRPHVRAAPRRR